MVTGEEMCLVVIGGGKGVQCGAGASFDISISDIDECYIRLIHAPLSSRVKLPDCRPTSL